MAPTPHQQAEADLTDYGLSLPETDAAPGWTDTRCLRVRGKMFAVFGDKGEADDALTYIVKLPISAEMVVHLDFVREPRGWYKQHNWVVCKFGPQHDIVAELQTLKAWLLQSYVALAPKRLGRLVSPT